MKSPENTEVVIGDILKHLQKFSWKHLLKMTLPQAHSM